MAKVMQFTDNFGNTLASSYWRIVQINLSIADRSGMIVMYGYVSRVARNNNKQPIGQKSYDFSGEEFDSLMGKHLSPGGKNLLRLAYEDVVNERKDVPAPTPENPNAKKNFFEGATDALD